MRKKFLLLTVALSTATGTALANYMNTDWFWNEHCNNGSCVASAGQVQIYFTTSCASNPQALSSMATLQSCINNNIEVTGISGLPISISDFQKAQKDISMAIQQFIHKSESNSSKTGTEAVGTGSESSTNESLSMSENNTLSQGKTMGVGVSTNETLKFVNWWAKYYSTLLLGLTQKIPKLQKYMATAGEIMWIYQNGDIIPYVQEYLMYERPSILRKVDVLAPITSENKMLIYTKIYCSNGGDGTIRQCLISGDFAPILIAFTPNHPLQPLVRKMLDMAYQGTIPALRLIYAPGATPKSLYEKYQKTHNERYLTAAFAEWMGLTGKGIPNGMRNTNEGKFIAAYTKASISIGGRHLPSNATELTANGFGLSNDEASMVTNGIRSETQKNQGLYDEFMSDIKNNSKVVNEYVVPPPSITKKITETLKKGHVGKYIVFAGLSAGIIGSVYFFLNRKKKIA